MTVSCVIPAWNEAPRIGAVLDAVTFHARLAEVIVVDDGSTDGTAGAAARPGVTVIRQPNRGKSAAVATGIAAARHDLVLLIDSDLQGLTPAALEALMVPVLSGQADVSVSLRRNAPWLWQRIGLDYISGERLVPRHLLPPPGVMAALPRFGLEVEMNRRWIAAAARIAVVRWPAVDSPMKQAKRGARAGIAADLAMVRDIAATVGLPRAAAQIAAMRRLRVA